MPVMSRAGTPGRAIERRDEDARARTGRSGGGLPDLATRLGQ